MELTSRLKCSEGAQQLTIRCGVERSFARTQREQAHMSLMTMLNGLVKNPYSDAYQRMDEFELISWKAVFEQSIDLGASSREKVLRLRAINQALEKLKASNLQRAA
jgi:hypothetical protein